MLYIYCIKIFEMFKLSIIKEIVNSIQFYFFNIFHDIMIKDLFLNNSNKITELLKTFNLPFINPNFFHIVKGFFLINKFNYLIIIYYKVKFVIKSSTLSMRI